MSIQGVGAYLSPVSSDAVELHRTTVRSPGKEYTEDQFIKYPNCCYFSLKDSSSHIHRRFNYRHHGTLMILVRSHTSSRTYANTCTFLFILSLALVVLSRFSLSSATVSVSSPYSSPPFFFYFYFCFCFCFCFCCCCCFSWIALLSLFLRSSFAMKLFGTSQSKHFFPESPHFSDPLGSERKIEIREGKKKTNLTESRIAACRRNFLQKFP